MNEICREDYFVFVQEEWENLGNVTQANEELIHVCFNAMKHFTGIKEVELTKEQKYKFDELEDKNEN